MRRVVVLAMLGYRLHDKKTKRISLPTNGATDCIAKTKCQALERIGRMLRDQ